MILIQSALGRKGWNAPCRMLLPYSHSMVAGGLPEMS